MNGGRIDFSVLGNRLLERRDRFFLRIERFVFERGGAFQRRVAGVQVIPLEIRIAPRSARRGPPGRRRRLRVPHYRRRRRAAGQGIRRRRLTGLGTCGRRFAGLGLRQDANRYPQGERRDECPDTQRHENSITHLKTSCYLGRL